MYTYLFGGLQKRFQTRGFSLKHHKQLEILSHHLFMTNIIFLSVFLTYKDTHVDKDKYKCIFDN